MKFWKTVKTETDLSKIDLSRIDGIEYPELGSRWIRIARDGNPWGETEDDFVEIFDVKDGWVRFGRFYRGRYPINNFRKSDNRLQVSHFFALYQKYIPIPEKEDTKNG